MLFCSKKQNEMPSIFTGLITSKVRISILMRLFINPEKHAYLRELSDEFGVSPSQVRDELRQLNEAGFLACEKQGRQLNYRADTSHPLFNELNSMVKKALGMDKIVDSIITRLGNLQEAYLLDDYAEGKDTGIIDLLLVGDIDSENLNDLVKKTERYIRRKIRTLTVSYSEIEILNQVLGNRPLLLLWSANKGAAFGGDPVVAELS